MNTLEILYQAFRVRYSLNQLQQILDRGCRIALLGPGEAAGMLKGYFGEPVPPIGGGDPQEDLVEMSLELGESELRELKTCDACVVLFPDGAPEVEQLRELAEKIPIHVKTLWICLVDGPKGGSYHEQDLTLPTVQALPRGRAREKFLKLLMVALPQVVVILARHWSEVRTVFCKTLTRRTALRNGIRSGLSALPLKAVPVVGPVLSLLATSAETMILTSSQLRLSFVIAAAHNRPLDFFDRISELWPIVGTAFGFRGVSRTLIKLLPSLGPGVKATISFSGTYAIGEACRLYYEHGQPSSDEVRRELLRRSHEEGAKEAQRLFRKVLAGQPLEELERDEEGGELLEAVDGLTEPEPPTGDAIEPTVEIESVAEEVARPVPEPDADASAVEEESGEKRSPDEPKKPAKKARRRSSKASSNRGGDKDEPASTKKSKKRRKPRSKDGPEEKS